MAEVLHLIGDHVLPKTLIHYPLTASPLLRPSRPLPSTFDTLPEDLLVTILSLFDVRTVVSLRRVSKWFYKATELRPLWIRLARREVRGRGLPWPSSALPLTAVPTKTIEEYTVRATKVALQWTRGSESQLRTFPRCIIRPPNSVGWMRILKGRWLISELRGQQLDIWDLQNDQILEPVASYQGLKGNIDGSCIDGAGASSVDLIFSTSSHVSTSLRIDLPYLGCHGSTPDFILRDTFEGYSGLLDARAGLVVFSRSVSNETPLVRDVCTGSIVYFGSSEANQIPQRFLSARILEEYIFLLGPWTMEVYPITKIRSLMKDGHEDTLLKIVHPSQSLAYPGGEMAHHVAVLTPSSELSEPSSRNGDSEFFLGIFTRGTAGWMRLHVWLDSDSNSTTFTSSMQLLFYTMGFRTISCCWGESGQRMFLASVYRAGIRVRCGVAPSDPTLVDRSFEDSTAFRWSLVPSGGRDLLAGFVFDEASSICAVATCSGRIWLDDFSKSPSAHKCSGENPSWTEISLHPDPSWPILHPIPWLANLVPDQRISTVQFSDPMPWSTDVDDYFPMMNDPNCYGGARWFVNEALHIPGPASLVMFTISALYPRTCWSTRIIRVAGGRLVAAETDLDSQSYIVKLLGPDIGLPQVPGLFSRYGSMEDAAGANLDVDYAVVRRYVFWRNQVEDDPDELPLYLW